MTIQQFQRLADQQPFRPFVMHLADGRTLDVSHPELLVAVGRTVTLYQSSGSFHIVDLLLVIDIETVSSDQN